jgi:hypothetical protein
MRKQDHLTACLKGAESDVIPVKADINEFAGLKSCGDLAKANIDMSSHREVESLSDRNPTDLSARVGLFDGYWDDPTLRHGTITTDCPSFQVTGGLGPPHTHSLTHGMAFLVMNHPTGVAELRHRPIAGGEVRLFAIDRMGLLAH